ncbi:MAG: PaaI family thioesterase [Mycobacteriales bacterium]
MTAAGRERLTAELRRLTRLSVAAQLDDHAAERAAAGLAQVAAQLEAPMRATPWWWQDPAVESVGGWERFNPVAPPLQISFDGRAVTGRVEMGVEFTGPPQAVHGGFVATVLDHVLGIYLSRIERPSFTSSLEVRYLAPTPLGVTLDFEATHSIIEGSRTQAWAELRHEGRTTARAEGRFRLTAAANERLQRSTA